MSLPLNRTRQLFCSVQTCNAISKVSIRKYEDDDRPKGACGRHVAKILDDMIVTENREVSLLITLL